MTISGRLDSSELIAGLNRLEQVAMTLAKDPKTQDAIKAAMTKRREAVIEASAMLATDLYNSAVKRAPYYSGWLLKNFSMGVDTGAVQPISPPTKRLVKGQFPFDRTTYSATYPIQEFGYNGTQVININNTAEYASEVAFGTFPQISATEDWFLMPKQQFLDPQTGFLRTLNEVWMKAKGAGQ
jgi:hypothetical protein